MSRLRRSVPGPFRRLARSPQRLGAVVLLCVTALAAAGVQSSAAVVLKSTIDDSWRGDYDILVTATESLAEIDGMLPPNALGGGDRGMTVDDWQRVRAVEGVGVAAPLGHVLVPGLRFADAKIVIPAELVRRSETPQAYRVTSTYTTDDGLGERIVQQERQAVVFDPAGGAVDEARLRECLSQPISFGTRDAFFDIDPAQYPRLARSICAGTSATAGTGSVSTYYGEGAWGSTVAGDEATVPYSLPAPRVATRIDLVDPQAERALLGERGAFLEPLIEIAPSAETTMKQLGEWARERNDELSTKIARALTQSDESWWGDESEEVLDELRLLFTENGLDFDTTMSVDSPDSGSVPLLISEVDSADLTLRIDVEAFGEVTSYGDSTYAIPSSVTASQPGERVGTAVGDVSALLNPFQDQAVGIAWPGTDALTLWDSGDFGFFTQQIPEAAAGLPLAYAETEQGIVLNSLGFVPAIPDPDVLYVNSIPLHDDGSVPGSEAAYVKPTELPPVDLEQLDSFTTAVPVGTFDASDAAVDESAVNHVPLGVYSSASSQITDGPHSGATMKPSLSGLGIVASDTIALASIHSAELWKDSRPIDSIRVRVEGIGAYTPEARSRVIAVAQGIEQLGYTARIMAGASSTATDVLVDGYAFGTDDIDTPQQVGELGTVTQMWSELGAAARVDTSVSTASLTMLGIALAAGILLLAATQVATVPARRQQSIVFRELGITRARTARWFAAEELPALIVVPVVAAIAWLLSGRSAVAAVAAGIAIGAMLVTSVLAVVGASHPRPARVRDHRSRRRGARTVGVFGLRQAVIHPVTTASHAAAILIIGVAAASLTQAVLESRTAAGSSNLAQLVTAQLLVPQLALGAVGVIGGFLLARIVRGMDLRRRGDQWATLRAAGWTSGQVGRAQRAEGLAIAVPALLITAAAVIAIGVWLDWNILWLPVCVAVAVGAVSAVTSFTMRVKGAAL